MAPTVRVHFLPPAAPLRLAGVQAVVVDLLRASTTICAALAAGACSVRPVLEPADATALRDRLAPVACLLGGERAGVLISGFDLGNSPSEYTPARVRGRDVIFTTTNGTRAIHWASDAGARVLIGCLANLSSLTQTLARDGREAHVVCAGTNGEVSMEDVLCAGAIVAGLTRAGFVHQADDQSRLAQRLFESAAASPGGVLAAPCESRGGRNLLEIGLGADLAACAGVDSLPVVPVFDRATGAITPAA